MEKLATTVVLASACTLSPFLSANEKMEETIVTSSRVEMPLRQVATAVSIVTNDDIKNLGLIDLAGVLRTQPSIAISNTGGVGATTTLKIRGEEGFRTLVLIDGIDISDTSGTQTGPNLENLLSHGVSRVEILRGAQGMMYGADAGGIINITSYIPEDDFGGEISVEGGRYDAQSFNASIGGKNEIGNFSLTGSDYKTDGFNSRTTDSVLQDDDGYKNTTLHARGGWNASDKLQLQLTVRNIEADNDYDTCLNTNFAEIDPCNNTFEQTGARLSAKYSGDRFSHLLAASSTEIDREFFSDGLSSFAANGQSEKYEYLGSFKVNGYNTMVYGADLKKASMEDGGSTFERDQTGIYTEYQGNFDENLYITAGVRYDDNDDFGDFTSYRFSSAYLLATTSATVKLKTSFGTGFRAPSLFEIRYNNGPFGLPPASVESLKDEESQGFDLGIEYFAGNGLHLELVYFDQRVKDEIFFDLAHFSGYLQGNGKTESTGVELIADAPLAKNWHFNGNYTYNDTENSSGGDRIQRPKHLLNIGILYAGESGRFIANLYIRGSYEAIDSDGSDLDDYQVVNLSASFNITDTLEIYGRIENLLDEDYQEVPTYNTSGIAGYAGLRYSF